MKEIFNKITGSIIASSVAAIVAALILIFAPGLSIATLGIAAGILLIAWGLIMIFIDSRAAALFIPFEGMLIGVISIVLGIALLSNPSSISVIILFAVGIWIIISSLNNLKMAFALKKTNTEGWGFVVALAVIDLVIGIIVILNPFASAVAVTIFLGIMLLAHSIVNLIDTLILRRNVTQLETAVKGIIKEAEIVDEPKEKSSSKSSGKSKKAKESKTSKEDKKDSDKKSDK